MGKKSIENAVNGLKRYLTDLWLEDNGMRRVGRGCSDIIGTIRAWIDGHRSDGRGCCRLLRTRLVRHSKTKLYHLIRLSLPRRWGVKKRSLACWSCYPFLPIPLFSPLSSQRCCAFPSAAVAGRPIWSDNVARCSSINGHCIVDWTNTIERERCGSWRAFHLWLAETPWIMRGPTPPFRTTVVEMIRGSQPSSGWVRWVAFYEVRIWWVAQVMSEPPAHPSFLFN